ncbi:ECF RNA polymerase sigma factor SigW [Aquisphaera giovannonii]|uniref:ECF RNA polymerase sigma factor SigW n=1 Tax=Aquisphaera giovannonii TaxID=406548 RepID=A0A5B9WA80_9BACT|nr:RNA polymerase sigma factor [Aquisphaera giovannonii]QEH36770.1 ECF RNA polymerase sigma factor SigW [Aquisphaera giovannonii]
MASAERSELLTQIERLYQGGTSAYESDGQLLDRYLSRGDESAFESIVERHGPLVLSLCRRFLRDRGEVEDAFQATFLVLARKASSIRNRPALSSWLYGVAYKVATRARGEALRRREREATGLDFDPEAPAPASAGPDEIAPAIDQELSRLPEKFRAPIVLCYLKEQTHDQAAAELRWPVGTVRSRLARGRALLRDRLARRGCSPVAGLIGAPAVRSVGRFLAPVPAPLVTSTVAEVARFLAGPAGAAARPLTLAAALTSASTTSGSATTLAQGVLTTMAFTPLKMVATGLTAGVLIGGLGTGAYTLRPAAAGQEKAPAAPAAPPPVQEKGARAHPDAPPVSPELPPPRPDALAPRSDPRFVVNDPGVDARLNALERKIDLLLERLGDAMSRPTPTTPSVDVPVPLSTAPALDRRVPDAPASDSLSPLVADEMPIRRGPLRKEIRSAPELAPDVEESRLPAPRPSQAPTPAGTDSPALRVIDPSPSRHDSALPIGDSRSPFQMEGGPDGDGAVALAGTRRPLDPGRGVAPTSMREIEAAIGIALTELARSSQLYRQGALSQKEFRAPAEQVQLLIGRLRGIQDELAEEAERQTIEIQKAEAELQVATAEQKAADGAATRFRRLKERGEISSGEHDKAESELSATTARVAVRQAGLSAVMLRARQVKARRDAAHEIIETAQKQLAQLVAPDGPAMPMSPASPPPSPR